MTEGSLSPFLEQPLRIDGLSSLHSEKVARLEYELASMKTEKRLVEQSKESCVARYEQLLSRKNEELARLQSNFDFVFNQRKELQLKMKNQQDVVSKSSSESDRQVKTLTAEKRALSAKIDKYERALLKTSNQCEHLRSDFNRELAANDQYRERVKALVVENKELARLNDDLLQRSNIFKTQLESDFVRTNEELKLRVISLQKTNDELQNKIDLLLQQKTSVELLKEKNASLSKQLKELETCQSRAAQLELANIELQAKFDEYFGMISSTIESHQASSKDEVVKNFIHTFKLIQNRNLILADKLNQALSEYDNIQRDHHALLQKVRTEYEPQINTLNAQVSTQNVQLQELKTAKILNEREIEFLRQSLKDLDDLTSRQKSPSSSQTKDNTEKLAMNQYLTNLEKLVDDYKQEIELLRKKSSTPTINHNVPTKRPRLVDEEITNLKTANSLRKENLELSVKVKDLQEEIEVLRKQLALSKKGSDEIGQQVLELRANPFSALQMIKQETLDLLRQENHELIAKYVNSETVDSIPKSLFARQENDKDMLQSKIDQLLKKLNRLRSVYADKSRDLVAIISRFFGYSIEFIPSPVNPNDLCSKIKLVSKYIAQKGLDDNNPYLIIDVHSRSLKANGNYEFKSLCEDLVDRWVSEKHQIPCFLSALNLKIYEEYGRQRKVINE